MGDIQPGEDVEDIIAEPEVITPGFLQSIFLAVHQSVLPNGWYILAAGLAIYFLWKNKISPAIQEKTDKSPEALQSWQAKEEQRLKAIQRLQEKYKEESDARAEKQKLMDEEKKRKRMIELEELTKNSSGQKLGDGSSQSKASFKPEYNPLMGDSSSSGRVCFRRPGGGSAGG